MPKSAPSRSTKQPGPPSAGKQAPTKKLVYAAALKDRNRKITQEVQAALRNAHAGELLFRKARCRMPDADRTVFDYFAENTETAREVDYLAYASYAFSKFEWSQRYLEQNGREPTQAETDKWVGELPDSRLDEIHDTASRVFRSAARAFMADPKREAQREAVLTSIDTEVKRHNGAVEVLIRSATSFRSNLWPNIGVSILSSFIFSIVIILASAIVTKDPSPTALLRSLVAGGPVVPPATAP